VKAAAAKSVVDAKREPVESGCMAAYESATGVAAEAKQTMDARMQAGEESTHASAQAYVVDEMVNHPWEKREAADAKSEGNRTAGEEKTLDRKQIEEPPAEAKQDLLVWEERKAEKLGATGATPGR